jgi:hypothetical protein
MKNRLFILQKFQKSSSLMIGEVEGIIKIDFQKQKKALYCF